MSITKIKKRNGNIVDFDKDRIRTALNKAFEATETIDANDKTLEELTDQILQTITSDFDDIENIPSVEQIQDYIEQKLVETGNFEVAKRYILYRAEHARLRAESRLEELRKLEKNLLKIVNSAGQSKVFDIKVIEKEIRQAALGKQEINVDALLNEIKRNVYEGISTKEISQAIRLACKAFIEKDHEYSMFTARILLSTIYKEVFGQNTTYEEALAVYAQTFKKNLQKGVENGRVNPELLNYDFKKLTAAFKPERDFKLTYLGLQTLYDRYFIHVGGQRIEAPQQFWMRVAMGLALKESPEKRDDWVIEFYNQLSELRFVSSTPTLFNAGTQHSQLSSCYLSTVEDSLDHIFKVIADNAQLSKWAGGIGNDWTNIRATSSDIHGTNGKSQGVIPFLKIVNDTAVAVNQGGKRKGAVCSYLECWHYDYPEFIELRRNTGDDRRRTHDMNTASWIPDLFMKRVESGGNWTLFSPSDVPELHHIFGREFEAKYQEYEQKTLTGEITLFKTLPAADLWRKMITMLFETGHPWMTFKDPCNVRSPQDHAGVVHDSNLCTEITLNNSKEETAVCNLGSLNLSEHVDPISGELQKDKMAKTINVAMRMLDNVVDINFYPTPETENSNMKHRPVGLGMMGLADYFYMRNLDFASESAVKASDELMEFISYNTILSSSELAKERGAYQSFKGSKWDRDIFPHDTVKMLEEERGQSTGVESKELLDWNQVRQHVKEHGMRNSNTMAIAPTATISNIAGCIPCTEPIYKNLYVKSNMGGEFTVINKYLINDLKKLNLWGDAMIQALKAGDGSIQDIEEIPVHIRDKYKEVFEISPIWILKHAAHRGKWIDQAQSTNIFYRGTSGREIAEIYMQAWKMGLKTTYYLRTLGATQVEKSTVETKGTHKRDFSKSSLETGSPATPSPEAPKAEAPAAGPVGSSAVASAAALMGDPDCEACQ